MSIFIKAGLWLEKKTGYKGEFNLTKFVENLIADIPPPPPPVAPYKVYTALLSQNGTTAPVPTILENTIGNIVWTRIEAGFYIATLNGAFTAGKTFVNGVVVYQPTSAVISVIGGRLQVNSTDSVIMITKITSGNNNQDNVLYNSPIEIRVYN
jgi:hypothetical protein